MVSARNVPERFQKCVSMRSHTPPIASSVQAKSSRLTIDNAKQSESSKDVRLPISRYVLFLFLALGGVTLDLLTKSLIFARCFDPGAMIDGRSQQVHWWIDGVFGIQCSTNPGALFGLGSGYSFVFAIISFVALAGIVIWLFWFKQAMDRWVTFALGLITGGILGNLYDRIGLGFQPGYPEHIRDNVRDWIYFRWEGGWKLFDPWPNFNIADSLLVTGAILLFLHAVFYPDPNSEKKKTDTHKVDEVAAG